MCNITIVPKIDTNALIFTMAYESRRSRVYDSCFVPRSIAFMPIQKLTEITGIVSSGHGSASFWGNIKTHEQRPLERGSI